MDLVNLLKKLTVIGDKKTLVEIEKREATGDRVQVNEDAKEMPANVKGSMADFIRVIDSIAEAKEKVEEDDVEEGNEFSGELAKAKAAGKKEFKVGDKTYQVKEAADEDRPRPIEKEITWTDKSGKKHPGKQVQGWQSVKADKEARKAAEKDQQKESVEESAQVSECGMVGGQDQSDSGMSVTTSIDTRSGQKNVSVNATGDAADQLMQLLKLSGVNGQATPAEQEPEVKVVSVPLAHAESGFKMPEEGVEENYSNEPNPQVQGVETQMRQGNDLNKEKTMFKQSYRQGDNPMAMKESEELGLLEAEIAQELESIKLKPVNEKYMGFKKVAAAAKKGGARDPEAVAAAIGRKKYGKKAFQKAAAAGKKMG